MKNPIEWTCTALHTIGFDATVADCNEFFKSIEIPERATDDILKLARDRMQSEDPGKKYYVELDKLRNSALKLLSTPEGRDAVRASLPSLNREQLAHLFGF
jgi:hypothetical protein